VTKKDKTNDRKFDLRLAVLRSSLPAGTKISRVKLAKVLEVNPGTIRRIERRALFTIVSKFWQK